MGRGAWAAAHAHRCIGWLPMLCRDWFRGCSGKAHLEPTVYEHTSIFKFIETIFGLPTLASVNHRFDTATPGGPNNEASGGNPVGPPAPPRDGRNDIGNLLECFQF